MASSKKVCSAKETTFKDEKSIVAKIKCVCVQMIIDDLPSEIGDSIDSNISTFGYPKQLGYRWCLAEGCSNHQLPLDDPNG